jgi:small subunit ribosomal protein S1
MDYNYYLPEGSSVYSQENLSYISSLSGLERAMREDRILEANAIKCDEEFNLYVDLCGIQGIISREECVLTQNGEPIKDIAIITRVGKPVCFKVLSIEPCGDTFKVMLSRKMAQIECESFYISSLKPGDIIPATVTHLDRFGAFVDIGCGIPSLLSIDCISISRISHPQDRLHNGQHLDVVVKSHDEETGRIFVTLKELLGTWQENANEFSIGQTVSGIVRSIESYGIFIELSPNLAGLAELREDNPVLNSIEVGDAVSVYIKSIIPDRMKIKLILIDVNTYSAKPSPIRLCINTKQVKHLDSWRFSPDGSPRIIETLFE